jgi:hypothetical protein
MPATASAPRQIPNFFSDKRGEEDDKHDEKQPQPHTAALTMATNDDCDLVFDCDDETSSELGKEEPWNVLDFDFLIATVAAAVAIVIAPTII